MFGRRSHARYSLGSESNGLLRVLSDVAVRTAGQDELVVISREPAIVGEVLQVHLAAEDATVLARVAESRPVVIEGAVRHSVRMTVVPHAASASAGEAPQS